jgi:hypothetical protein
MKDRPRALAVLVAVFLVGILIGAAGSYLWFKPEADTPRAFDRRTPPTPSSPGGPSPEIPDFNLTSEQEKKLKIIWKETGEKLRSLMHEQREFMVDGDKKREEIIDENDRRVRAELNEEQKAIFDPWIEELRKQRQRSPRRMGPEPPKDNRRKPGDSNSERIR